jgi:hypothetical protein
MAAPASVRFARISSNPFSIAFNNIIKVAFKLLDVMDRGTILTDRFDRALLYATHVHGGQVRKGTSTPYISRSLFVPRGCGAAVILICFLHLAQTLMPAARSADSTAARAG